MKFTRKRNMISQIKNNLTKNTEIRFYDNTPEMIKQFRTTLKYVEPILVSNKPNEEVLNGNPNANIYINEFIKLYPNNKFAQYMYSIRIKEIKTNIGFDIQDAYNLLKWACKPSLQDKIAIFDWDGTLSVIEGIHIPNNQKESTIWKKNGINYRDIAIYYAGTKERLLWLKEMFIILYKKGIKVYILTNNPVAVNNWRAYPNIKLGSETRYNFFKVAKQFIPQIKEQEILCGYETNCFKPDTFLQFFSFTNIL